MKNCFWLIAIVLTVAACDDSRVYEKNHDFENRQWIVDTKPSFEFVIEDTTATYNLYCNIRNSVGYPFSRIFIQYSLNDSIKSVDKSALLGHTLFDPKTGEPSGTSGLGDIYDHQVPIVKGQRFSRSGTYEVTLQQNMRRDTLEGILAVGIRVEKVSPETP